MPVCGNGGIRCTIPPYKSGALAKPPRGWVDFAACCGGETIVAERVFLLDASVYVFRAWFSVSDGVSDDEGLPANAVFGYGAFLCDLLERQRPDYIVAAFDESLTSSFRNDIYPDYKANRPPPPDDLRRQFQVCQRFTEALGVPVLASERYEADDLIGSFARRVRGDAVSMVYTTADKDLAQLMEGTDSWWDAARDRWLDAEGVRANLGVAPHQIADLLGLAGDSVDNIPGVPGIGRKTAAALLAALESLDGVYADLDAVTRLGLRGAKRVRGLLETHREQAYLSRELTRIHCEVPLNVSLDDARWQGWDGGTLDDTPLPRQLRNRALRLAEAYPD
ncbi:flap endonuclease [Ectothiorhodospiraceae bacterium WFHF3C12]|nr:flap endonuclease [Ectothiorhodospiraceae bacterium WFHF3C12]